MHDDKTTSTTPDNGNGNGNEGGNGNGTNDDTDAAKAEEAFWSKFEEKFSGLLESFFEKKKKELIRPSTSRTGESRPTIARVMANIMYGPEKKD